jgi:hypothetical protein
MYHEDMHHQVLPSQRLTGSTRQFWPSTLLFVMEFRSPAWDYNVMGLHGS